MSNHSSKRVTDTDSVGNTKRFKSEYSYSSKDNWPESFKELEQIHFRLNSYYTFLCSRKHIATTFDVLKSAPESVIKRKLTYSDLAKIKYLIKEDIVFQYVDENQIILEDKQFSFKDGYTQKDVDIFELKKLEESEKSKQLLIFEFVDGDLRKSKVKSTYKTEMKVPIYTQESMKRLITKRDKKFFNAIVDFLLDCEEKSIQDEMSELSRVSEKYLPKPKVFVDPIQQMLDASSRGNSHNVERLPISDFIRNIKSSKTYKDQIVQDGEFNFEAREPHFGDLTYELEEDVLDALLSNKSIDKFYSHQAEALNAIHDGKNIIVSTSTSSGKSLIYQLPVINSLKLNDRVTSMYIFPTKALAQDQRRSLHDLIIQIPSLMNISIETFDGDTEKSKRDLIKNNAKVIFTNPDMLHSNILPNHTHWRNFLMNLKYVVIDELHMYKGLFGSHVALIMRRLRRICSFLGNEELQFISCSATLKDPVKHMMNIFGVDNITHIDEDGSPSGEKHLIVWNPPYLNKLDLMAGRESFIAESAKLLVDLVLNNVRTIAFCVVRKVCELLMKSVRQRFEELERPDLVNQVMSYRGGYSASDRRKIETEMFHGSLKAVISTNALELGIDIGGLDAVLICGFPISTANFRQQSGRAGRRNRDSLTLLVGSDDPVNQHFMKHPQELIKQEFQDLVLDFDNLLVVEGHIQCAAFELPIELDRDEKYFGDKLSKICEERLNLDKYGYRCHGSYLPWPPKNVSIRAIEEESYAVVDITNGRNEVIEEIEASRTSFTLYDGGIFIHQGYPYLVREFNSDDKYAKVERVDVDWTTSQRDFTDVDPMEIEYIRSLEGPSDVPIYFGKIRTTIIVFGFFKIDKKNRILDAVEVNNPPVIINSKGFWIDIPFKALQIINDKKLNPAGGIHAAQHAIMSLLPLVIVSGADEVQTECKAPEKEFAQRQSGRKRPARLIFHDAKGGEWGSGLSSKAFEHVDELLEQTFERIRDCKCSYGCPECVAAPICKENSLVLSKSAALIIISVILGKDIDYDEIPDGPEPNMPEISTETVVPVGAPVKMSKDVEIIDVRKADEPLSNLPKVEEIESAQENEKRVTLFEDIKPESKVKLEDEEEKSFERLSADKNDETDDELSSGDDIFSVLN